MVREFKKDEEHWLIKKIRNGNPQLLDREEDPK
jgi:hypothetical protein